MGKWNLRAAIGALSVLAAVSFGSMPAANALSAEGTRAHCAVEIYPTGTINDSPEQVCFATEDEVAAYLTSIGVGDSTARGAAVEAIVGTVYKDNNATGASLTFWGSSGCTGVTFGFPSLASGWDNSISSARASNGCWVTLYTTTSYGGSRLNCTPYCASVGTWNDNVKSLVFRPEGTFG